MSEKRDPKDYTTVTVLKKPHEEIIEYLNKLENDFKTIHIGKFYEMAAAEKLKNLKNKNSLFGKFNSQTLFSNGFSKAGGSSYKRGDDIVRYDGVYWFYNDERLTEENYIDKIYDKLKTKF